MPLREKKKRQFPLISFPYNAVNVLVRSAWSLHLAITRLMSSSMAFCCTGSVAWNWNTLPSRRVASDLRSDILMKCAAGLLERSALPLHTVFGRQQGMLSPPCRHERESRPESESGALAPSVVVQQRDSTRAGAGEPGPVPCPAYSLADAPPGSAMRLAGSPVTC